MADIVLASWMAFGAGLGVAPAVGAMASADTAVAAGWAVSSVDLSYLDVLNAAILLVIVSCCSTSAAWAASAVGTAAGDGSAACVCSATCWAGGVSS